MDIYFERIKPLFDSTGFSVQKLAKEIGISPRDIYHWNNDGYKTYDKYLYKIAAYFNVSEAYLRGETDDPAPQKETPAGITDEQLKFALWGDTTDITDADLEDVRRFAAFIKQKREQEGRE